MLNPFTREQDAFKMLVAVIGGAALVIAVTLISGSSVAGILLAVSLVLIAAGKLWGDYRRLDDAD